MKLFESVLVWARTKGLGWLRSEATTMGVSPKVLAGPIAVGITAVLKAAGFPVDELARAFGVSEGFVDGVIVAVAAVVAGYLLGPGAVVPVVASSLKGRATGVVRRKTGRRRAVWPVGLKEIGEYVVSTLSPPATFAAPAGSYPMDGNDKYGDCTLAGVAHLLAAWNRLFGHALKIPGAAQIVAVYLKLKSGIDNGMVEADVLKTWQTKGLFGTKIAAYAPIRVKAKGALNQAGLKRAIAFYGGVYLGIACPESAQRQFSEGKPWIYEGEETEDGHCIVGLGYTKDGLLCGTWGKVVLVTWDFLEHYLDEAWCVISQELVSAGKDTLNVDIKALRTDLASL